MFPQSKQEILDLMPDANIVYDSIGRYYIQLKYHGLLIHIVITDEGVSSWFCQLNEHFHYEMVFEQCETLEFQTKKVLAEIGWWLKAKESV